MWDSPFIIINWWFLCISLAFKSAFETLMFPITALAAVSSAPLLLLEYFCVATGYLLLFSASVSYLIAPCVLGLDYLDPGFVWWLILGISSYNCFGLSSSFIIKLPSLCSSCSVLNLRLLLMISPLEFLAKFSPLRFLSSLFRSLVPKNPSFADPFLGRNEKFF